MAVLSERPYKNIRPDDFNNETFEKVMKHQDENFRKLDSRRIAQVDTLASDATTDNIISKMNELINALNASDLTEES